MAAPQLTLLAAHVAANGELQVQGYCAPEGEGRPNDVKAIYGWLRRKGAAQAGDVTKGVESPLPNLMSKKAAFDLSESTFAISFGEPEVGSSAQFVVELGIEFAQVCVKTRFSRRYSRGSAGTLTARTMRPGVYLQPGWGPKRGLCLSVVSGQPFLDTNDIHVDSGTCSLTVALPKGFHARQAQWSDGGHVLAPRISLNRTSSDTATVSFDVRALKAQRLKRRALGINLIGADGSTRRLRTGPGLASGNRAIGGTDALIAMDRICAVQFIAAQPDCVAQTIEVAEDERALVVQGRYTGPPPSTLTLHGARVQTQGLVEVSGPDEFTCQLPLHAVGWLGQDRPLPSGEYWVEFLQDDGTRVKLRGSRALDQELPKEHSTASANIRIERDSLGFLAFDIAPPLAPAEVGDPGRKNVTAPGSRKPIVDDALYLESWFGKSFSDNPAPLADALRDDFKDIHVGVLDHSVEVPDFVKPVIIGSREWWQVTTTSRVVVNNSWLPGYFKRRRGQKVVQTWHGTPLKKLGFDRAQHEGRASTPKTFAWGSSKWDLLVSPNAYSTEILRRAYTYDGQIAEVGYPRNDVLSDEGVVRDRVRGALGIDPEQIVVLYAPTFREGQRTRSAFCDIEALARKLGSAYQLVVRGHSATLRSGSDHRVANVLDVTTYPESSHILAIADVLVTDYSSVMFDFTATRRPVVFFTPDMASYSTAGRGVYFDLEEQAPGPVIKNERVLAGAIRHAWSSRQERSVRYDAWVERFNTYDDGGATERLASVIREWL